MNKPLTKERIDECVEASAVHHETIELSRFYSAPCAVVFAAYADCDQRREWSAPPSVTLTYTQNEFVMGGHDVFICEGNNSPSIKGDVRYEDIQTNQRITFIETLTIANQRLSSALTTIELYPINRGTQFLITLQIASYMGREAINHYHQGWSIVLDNLDRVLTAHTR